MVGGYSAREAIHAIWLEAGIEHLPTMIESMRAIGNKSEQPGPGRRLRRRSYTEEAGAALPA